MPCWVRNDRASTTEAVVKTLWMTVRVVEAVGVDIRRHKRDGWSNRDVSDLQNVSQEVRSRPHTCCTPTPCTFHAVRC